MSLKTTRQAIAAELQADLRAGGLVGATFTIVPRELEPPQAREIGCLWVPERAENGENVSQEIVQLTLRIFLREVAGRRTEASSGVDPGKLEDLVEAVYASLADKQSANFGVWFLRCVGARHFPLERWCEVTIVAFQENPFPA